MKAKTKKKPVRKAKRKNPAPSYRAAHWGEPGRNKVTKMRVPNPSDFPLTVLGEEVISIVYLTIKAGDTEPTEYEHKFSHPRPALVYNRGGRLLFAGGGYKMESRGIVK